jgi:hypothetical protein
MRHESPVATVKNVLNIGHPRTVFFFWEGILQIENRD